MSDPTNPISKLFKPPVDPRSHREQRIPRAVQNSADFWVEIFITAVSDLVNSETYAVAAATTIASRARSLADAALVEFEDRWPGVKL